MASQHFSEPLAIVLGAAHGRPTVDLAAPWGGSVARSTSTGRSTTSTSAAPAAATTKRRPPPVVLVHGLGGSHLNWVGIGAPARAPPTGRGPRPRGLRVHAVARTVDVGAPQRRPAQPLRPPGARPPGRARRQLDGRHGLAPARRPAPRAGRRSRAHRPVAADPAPAARPQVAATFALYAVPRVGEAVLTRYNARYTDRQRVLGTIALCFADASRADDELIGASVELAAWRRTTPAPEADFLGAARSLLAVLRRPRRYDALIAGIDRPVLLVHGELDRLVPVSAARRTAALNPTWHTAYLDRCRAHPPARGAGRRAGGPRALARHDGHLSDSHPAPPGGAGWSATTTHGPAVGPTGRAQ